MKRILIYGDSITWGWIGWIDATLKAGESQSKSTGERYEKRYPRTLQKLLGNEWEVIEEGCPGRTTVYDSEVDHYVNGKTYLYPCLHSHDPLDYVVIMLGTNDLSNGVKHNAYYAAAGAERLVNEIRHYCNDFCCDTPRIILVSPPLIEQFEDPVLEEVFDYQKVIPESRKFRRFYKEIADNRGLSFLASEDYAKAGPDGIHITAEGHINLARGLYELLMKLEESGK